LRAGKNEGADLGPCAKFLELRFEMGSVHEKMDTERTMGFGQVGLLTRRRVRKPF
jgi:hypothetical protein